MTKVIAETVKTRRQQLEQASVLAENWAACAPSITAGFSSLQSEARVPMNGSTAYRRSPDAIKPLRPH